MTIRGPDPRRWRILAVMLVAQVMSLVAISIINVALPSIQQGLGTSDSQLQWVLGGYTLTYGFLLVPAGRAGDLFGRGFLFILGVAVFTAASIGAAFAVDPTALNLARAVQGIGSGLLSPQGVAIVQHYFSGAERAKAFSFFGAAVGISVAIGPVVGGMLIDIGGVDHGWRWTFLLNVPIGITAIVLAWRWFPRPLLVRRSRANAADSAKPSLDPVGAALLGLAVLAVLLAFAEGRAFSWAWLGIPVGAFLVLAWIAWERAFKAGGRAPVVDLGLFRIRSFAYGAALMTLYFSGITSVWVLAAMYFQDGLGHSALATGLLSLPASILSGIGAIFAGRNVPKYGRLVVVCGIYFAVFGLVSSMAVVLLRAAGLVGEWWLLGTLAFVGLAQGTVISPNQTLTLENVPLDYAGSAGGVMQTGQRVGTTVGIAMITAVAFYVLGRADWARALVVGFAAITLIVAATLVVAHLDAARRRRSAAGGVVL